MSISRLRSLALLAAALLALLATPRSRAAGVSFRVIVNHANGTAAVDRKFVTDAFLKRTTRWPGGEPIRPVDLGTESATRRRFSDEVLSRSVAAVKSYWQQMIFSGRAVPPPELDSEEEVIRYVSKYPGAVGYVSGSADTTPVKVLLVK
jgi:ABC-type phosphate transport system substrate-binding protein